MAKKKEQLSEGKLGYWEVREAIQDAVLSNDTETIKMISLLYPETFNNVLRQATNQKKKVH